MEPDLKWCINKIEWNDKNPQVVREVKFGQLWQKKEELELKANVGVTTVKQTVQDTNLSTHSFILDKIKIAQKDGRKNAKILVITLVAFRQQGFLLAHYSVSYLPIYYKNYAVFINRKK